MAGNEERCSSVCISLSNMSEGKGGASETRWDSTSFGDTDWKWDNIVMDFVTHLPRTFRGHDTI